MVKVLVVDDSAFVRSLLASVLEADDDIRIIGTASNGEDAVTKARELDPDVITMDMEMPLLSGLDALERIMNENPCPVIMISSVTGEGADATLKALELGALDFMLKPVTGSLPDMESLEEELRGKVKALARRKAFLRLLFCNRNQGLPERVRKYTKAEYRRPFAVVSIGVSTGGPPAVQKILTALPAGFPVPILIAQHMPAAFTGPFAARLDSLCDITVKEAEPVEQAEAGTVYICPGGKHLRLENHGGLLMAVVTEDPREALYKPSANVLMETSAIAAGCKTLGITLTGMGSDGVEGTRVIREKGGRIIAQNEASCAVYGMPKAVVDAGLADEIVDIDDMADAILSHFIIP